MIYTVTLNPALDKTAVIPDFAADRVNRIASLRLDAGGKGINVSKVLAALGEKSVAFALAGGDTGRLLRRLLAEQGLCCEWLETAGETRTNLKIIDPKRHTNTDINEPGQPAPPAVLAQLRQLVVQRLQPGDLVVLAGSLPAGAPPDTYRQWTEDCRRQGARVFLDADGAPLAQGLAGAPWLVKPNREELERLCGRALPGADDLVRAARELLAGGVQCVVVSLGGDGALYLSKERSFRAQALPVPVGSTVGAGDSMVAALACALQRGWGMEQAVRFSTATAAANVMTSGTQPADLAQIEPLLAKVRYQELNRAEPLA